MKKPAVDINRVLTGRLRANLGFKNRFLSRWGTHMDGGVEVLDEKKYYHTPGFLSSNKKLFTLLRVYNDLADNPPTGVASAWLYINQDKVVTDAISKTLIATQLNSGYALNSWREYTMGIHYSNNSNAILSSGTTAEMITYINDNWSTIISSYSVEAPRDNELEYVLSKYALFGDVTTLETEVTDVNREVTQKIAVTEYGRKQKYLEVSVNFTLRVRRIAPIIDSSPIVIRIDSFKEW